MSLPWIPRISYGGVTFDLSLPQRPWVPISRGIGGYEESAAGIPSTWEYRRDAMRRMTIRFMEAEWGEVLAWLIHAQRGGQFGIAPDYRGDSYTCYLVAPRMGEDIEPRPGDFPGVWELDLVIRTVSGAVIPGRYYGITPLIDWSPGQMLSTMHFSRPSPAMYRDRSGAWHSVAPDVPRTTWGTDPVTGLPVPRTLLEPGATNYASSTSVTGGESGLWEWTMPAPGRYRLTALVDAPAHASNYPGIIGPYAAAADEAVTLSTWIATVTSPHLEIRANGFSGSTPDTRADGRQVITITHGAPWVHSLAVYAPAGVRADIRAGDYIELVLPQIEATPYATSPILTDGAPEDRSRDTLYLDLPPEIEVPGAPMAIYSRAVLGGKIGSSALWGIGSSAPRLTAEWSSTGVVFRLAHASGEASTFAVMGQAVEAGDLVESLALVWTDELGRLVGRLIARILRAGSSQWGPIHAADLPPLEPAPEWSARRLYIGSRGTAPGVYEYEAFRVWEMAQGVWRGSPRELLARARTDRMGVR